MVYSRKGKGGTTWCIEYVDAAGRRHRQATTAITKKQAEVLEAELRVREERRARGLEPHDRNPQRHTVATLVEWYLKQSAKTANARHLGYTLRAAVTGDFAGLRIDDVTAPVVRAFLASAAMTDVVKGSIVRARSASTVNRLRAYLSGMFRAAVDAGLLVGENPVRGTRAMKTEAPVPRALPADVVVAVRRAMLRAGVAAPEGTAAVFHSLRGAWASQWIACGADVGLVEFVGWGPRASSVMQTSYLTYPVGHLRAEIHKLSWAPKAPATVLALPAKAGA